MAKQVTVSMAETRLRNKGVYIHVYEDGEKLGRLEIGKATIIWYDKGAHNPTATATWEQFIEWMHS
jgi:hypothetical protein